MPKELERLRCRKEELLLESEINRQIIALEVSQLKLKAVEWRHGFTRVGSVYKWVAPLAGIGLGFFAAKKQVQHAQRRGARHTRRNGHGKFDLLAMLAPLGATALKQGIQFWKHARHRAHSEP
jgi:hypothetical protein